MDKIPFTQYLRPDGRKVEVSVERPKDIMDKAAEIIAHNYRFECESLSDKRTVSFTIFDIREDEDVAVELCVNGPAVPTAVDKLVTEFHAKMKAQK